MKLRPFSSLKKQSGLTLVELMVAVVISLIVVLAATAALLMSRQGFVQVDAASLLRDNAKFAQTLIQRLAIQSGYRDVVFAATSRPALAQGMTTERPNVFGFNSAVRNSNDRSEEATGSGAAINGSDILVLRFQSAAKEYGSTTADQALIDCLGHAPSATMIDRYERFSSVFHIANSAGEPTLMCTRWPDADDFGKSDTQPLISGIENFQVLYGVDGITANNAVFATADSVIDAYLRADQISHADAQVSLQRWQRVRSIRIGMVVRAAPGTAIGDTNTPMHSFEDVMFSSSNDTGSTYTPPNDGRLRQIVTFTVHLRNPQGDE
jgi:type IV pilus assembly protein PilW